MLPAFHHRLQGWLDLYIFGQSNGKSFKTDYKDHFSTFFRETYASFITMHIRMF